MNLNNPLLNRAFRVPISRDRAKDAGMAVVLILLILDFFLDHFNLLPFAVGALVLNMVAPGIYNFFARFWFLLAELLGTLMSKVLLTIIFGIVVLPVGILYRLFGKDSLRLNQFKKGKGSVFRDRCHQFQPEDIRHPY
jgi:hypothetical protein